MRISHKHKFVMISVPKTGSTTLRKFLDPLSDLMSNGSNKSPYYDHTTANLLQTHFISKEWNWNNYFKFGFVRNPWDWMVSHWFYRAKFIDEHENHQHNMNTWSLNFLHACQFQFANTNGFGEWCLKYGLDEFKNQSEWLYNEDDVCLVDYIGKMEDFQNSFNVVCEKIGLGKKNLSVKNKTKHANYTSYYTLDVKNAVASKFSRDIDLFGYTFE